MDKRFENSGIVESKVDEIVRSSTIIDGKIAFRAVKELCAKEFFPSIMRAHGDRMPNESVQNCSQIEDFGISVFETEAQLDSFKLTINALRTKHNAKGHISKEKGLAGTADSKGHYQYYLFDPIKNNPVEDFSICSSEGKNNE